MHMYVLYCFCVPTLQEAIRILVMSGETLYCAKDSRRADRPLGVACCAVGVLVGWHVAEGSSKASLSLKGLRLSITRCDPSGLGLRNIGEMNSPGSGEETLSTPFRSNLSISTVTMSCCD